MYHTFIDMYDVGPLSYIDILTCSLDPLKLLRQLDNNSTQFLWSHQLRAMSSLDILRDPLLSSPLYHHVLDRIGNSLVVEGPNVSAAALEGLCVPSSRRTWTLERSHALIQGRCCCCVCKNWRYVLIQRRLWVLAFEKVLSFLDAGQRPRLRANDAFSGVMYGIDLRRPEYVVAVAHQTSPRHPSHLLPLLKPKR